MNELSCGVARDLLPLYADNLAGEESYALVEAHLAACEACRAELAAIRTSLPGAAPKAGKSLRRVRGRLKRLLTALISVIAGLALLFGLFVYGQVYYPPLRYKEEMIRVGPYNWDANEFMESGGEWYVMHKYSRIVDCSQVVEHINADGSLQVWAFINYKKDALWDRLFLDYGDSPKIAWTGGMSLYPPPYTPHLDAGKVHATVYWMDHIEKLGSLQIVERETDRLSQEVLDLCTLIWDGEIR
jgi:hypothetical protein